VCCRCDDSEGNTQYSGAGGRGPAQSCALAKANAIAAHRAYLRAFGVSSRAFPMLRLRPHEWEAPFVAMPEVNADVG
jgi:hypothetical protein